MEARRGEMMKQRQQRLNSQVLGGRSVPVTWNRDPLGTRNLATHVALAARHDSFRPLSQTFSAIASPVPLSFF